MTTLDLVRETRRVREAYIEADKRMKASNGHAYVTILKTRCMYCGRSPKQKGKCPQWFSSFLDRLTEVLVEVEK